MTKPDTKPKWPRANRKKKPQVRLPHQPVFRAFCANLQRAMPRPVKKETPS